MEIVRIRLKCSDSLKKFLLKPILRNFSILSVMRSEKLLFSMYLCIRRLSYPRRFSFSPFFFVNNNFSYRKFTRDNAKKIQIENISTHLHNFFLIFPEIKILYFTLFRRYGEVIRSVSDFGKIGKNRTNLFKLYFNFNKKEKKRNSSDYSKRKWSRII